MLADDRFANIQADAHAILLGCEKWFEQAGGGFRRKTATGVGHLKLELLVDPAC